MQQKSLLNLCQVQCEGEECSGCIAFFLPDLHDSRKVSVLHQTLGKLCLQRHEDPALISLCQGLCADPLTQLRREMHVVCDLEILGSEWRAPANC